MSAIIGQGGIREAEAPLMITEFAAGLRPPFTEESIGKSVAAQEADDPVFDQTGRGTVLNVVS